MRIIKWNNELDNIIRANAAIKTDEELATIISNKLGCTVTMQKVRKRRQKLGIMKASGRGKCEIVQQEKKFNDSSVAVSQLNYPSKDSVEVPIDDIIKNEEVMVDSYHDLF